jgi:hypothetical protein
MKKLNNSNNNSLKVIQKMVARQQKRKIKVLQDLSNKPNNRKLFSNHSLKTTHLLGSPRQRSHMNKRKNSYHLKKNHKRKRKSLLKKQNKNKRNQMRKQNENKIIKIKS